MDVFQHPDARRARTGLRERGEYSFPELKRIRISAARRREPEVAQRRPERKIRRCLRELPGPPRADPGSSLRRLARRPGGERALADAGLAPDQEHPAVALLHALERPANGGKGPR